MRRGRPRYPQLLTPREQEVLELLREGLTNQQIADRLGITRAGAAYHVGEILSKLSVSNRQDAARFEPGMLQPRIWGLAAILGLLTKHRVETMMRVSGIVAVAGGLGFVALLALGVGLTQLRGGQSADLDCVTGKAAANEIGAKGEENFQQEFLPTAADAEAFLCVRLPQVQQLNGWRVWGVNALRSNSLSWYGEGKWTAGDRAYKYTEIYHSNGLLGSFLTLIVHPNDLAQRQGAVPVCGTALTPEDEAAEEIDVIVQGVPTTLWIQPDPEGGQDTAAVCWSRDDLTFFAGVSFQPGFDVQAEVLPLLESIE